MNRLNLGLPFSACQAPECHQRDGLKRCGACRVVQYCSVDHQKAYRPAHKFYCGLIKKAHEKLAREEMALRNHTHDDDAMPANPFESCVGDFWLVFPTRSYMSARYDLVKQLNICTGEAVEAALANLLDMLRACAAATTWAFAARSRPCTCAWGETRTRLTF